MKLNLGICGVIKFCFENSWIYRIFIKIYRLTGSYGTDWKYYFKYVKAIPENPRIDQIFDF
jgi:hypothetical protein